MRLNENPMINRVRENAQRARMSIDTYYAPDVHHTKAFETHLKDTILHPTLGMLAYQKEIHNNGYNFPTFYNRNLNKMKSFPNIKKLIDMARIRINNLYHNDKAQGMFKNGTRGAREFLIESGRIKLDRVTRVNHNLRRAIFKALGV